MKKLLIALTMLFFTVGIANAVTQSGWINGTYGKAAEIRYLDADKTTYIMSKTIKFATANAAVGDVVRVLQIPENTRVCEVSITVDTACAANVTVDVGDGTDADFFGNGMPLDATGYVQTALFGSSTWDPTAISDGSELTTSVTIDGAAMGDWALPSLTADSSDMILTATVTSANTVEASLANNTSGDINVLTGTLSLTILKAFGVLSGGKLYTSDDTIDLTVTTDTASVAATTGIITVRALCMDLGRQ